MILSKMFFHPNFQLNFKRFFKGVSKQCSKCPKQWPKDKQKNEGENMKQLTKTKQIMAALLFLGSFVAWSNGMVDFKNEAFIESEVVSKDGSKTKALTPVSKVVPGEEVLYVITYLNKGKQAATDVVITNPIPKHMTYKAQEAEKSGIKAELSVDGGNKWGDLASLKVADKLRKIRPALPADVTHVRWKIVGAVQPNEEGKVRLRAVLN